MLSIFFSFQLFLFWGSRCFFQWQQEGASKTILELVPLVIKFLTTIEGFVWTIGFDSSAELFPGSTVLVSKWYGKGLVIRIGVF